MEPETLSMHFVLVWRLDASTTWVFGRPVGLHMGSLLRIFTIVVLFVSSCFQYFSWGAGEGFCWDRHTVSSALAASFDLNRARVEFFLYLHPTRSVPCAWTSYCQSAILRFAQIVFKICLIVIWGFILLVVTWNFFSRMFWTWNSCAKSPRTETMKHLRFLFLYCMWRKVSAC